MSAAESISYSPLTLTSGVVAMAVENSGVSSSNAAAAVSVGAPKSVVLGSASPKLNGTVAGIVQAVKLQNQEFQDNLDDILRSLNDLAAIVQDPAAREAIDPEVVVQSLKEQMKGLDKLGFSGMQMINDLLDEPSEGTNSTEESFQGTSISDAKAALAKMAMTMTGMQSALAEVQLSQMKESSVMSNKTLGMIEGQRDLANQNIDDQLQQQQKQKKLHRWMMIGMAVAMVVMVAAGQPELAFMMGATLALQKSGAMEAATSGMDSPVLKKLTEVAMLTAVTVLTAGSAAAVEAGMTISAEVVSSVLADLGLETLASSGVMGALEAGGTIATEVGMSEFASLAAEAFASLSDDALQLAKDNAISVAKNVAIMGAGQVLMTSGAITELSGYLADLFYLGQEDKNKAKEIAKMVTELVLTVAVSFAMIYAAASAGKATGKDLTTVGKLLMGASMGTQLATNGLGIYSGVEMLDIAKLQKEYSGYQAGLQQAQFLNKYNLDAMQTNQQVGRQMMQALQTTMLEVFRNLSAPTQAAAESVSRA